MKAWADMWALKLGMGATCLILIVGLAGGITPTTMVLRSVVVGAVLYLGLRILGSLVGAALLRLAVEHKLAKKRAAQAADDETEGRSGVRAGAARGAQRGRDGEEREEDTTAAAGQAAA